MGNPQPSFVSLGCAVHSPRLIAEKHLKFAVEQGNCRIDCIGFGMAERVVELTGEIDLLFRPALNTWRGQTNVQLQVVDFRPTAEE
jgi:single-stranded-DNA-specific exonuclease